MQLSVECRGSMPRLTLRLSGTIGISEGLLYKNSSGIADSAKQVEA